DFRAATPAAERWRKKALFHELEIQGQIEMNLLRSTILATSFLSAIAAGAQAQEMEGHGKMSGESPMTTGRIQLPEICLTAAEEEAAMPMGMAHDMDEAHAALMDGMDEMNQMMMTAMMAEDIDVAFVCGMIPHHQSAVNMAKA